MNEESRVEEVELVLSDEQSAAWREVAREAVNKTLQLGWAFWLYLIVKLGYEFFIFWMGR